METYEIYKTVHVLAAVVWVGGGATLQIQFARLRAAGDYGELPKLGHQAEWIGKKVFMPASILTLLFGILMVLDADAWGFGDPWILIGFGGILFSIITGAAFLGPESGKLAVALQTAGPDDPAVRSRMDRLTVISRVELVVLFLVVVDMVVKPGL